MNARDLIIIGDVLLAYFAGIIDADGTIGIKRQTYAMRVTKDCGQPTYSERVSIKQVESQAIDLLYANFGGYRAIENPTAERGRPLHIWQVTDKKAAVFLKVIFPYLRIKKEQARNCLKLRELKKESLKKRIAFGRGYVGAARRPEKISKQMETLFLKAKELNKVGI